MRKIHLQQDYAVVLREVDEHGGDYINNLVESLKFDRNRLLHILQTLQHKRLIMVNQKTHEAFIELTRRGERFVHSAWSQPSFA